MRKRTIFLISFFIFFFLFAFSVRNNVFAACQSTCVVPTSLGGPGCPASYPVPGGMCSLGAPGYYGTYCCTTGSYTCEAQPNQRCRAACDGDGESVATIPGGTCPTGQQCCSVPAPLPENVGFTTVDPPCTGDCDTIETAFGTISTHPEPFVKNIFRIMLSFSGGIVVILLIIAGYRLITSQGDPEKIKDARERMTSAIIGLIFIIMSFVFYQFITINILRLPGFTV